ncbi:MAG: glutamate racemase [Myxococcales bacterium]|nr:glutamate racemase [Myxococcales bacterium]MCB9568108.1 glutamate racemase [Myxococcales bacterium]MCB9705334.1 glutamate racemase [Myxococcales bacterium]
MWSVAELPIGVFDSGVGGLTVLRALREALPDEAFLYLGDTARLPYGTKSPETVRRYAEQTAEILVDQGVKMLVIACNTASAVAIDHLRRRFAPLPVVGVIEPGAQAAVAASERGEILVIATEGTVRGGAYERAIRALRPEAAVTSTPCALFVALAEEGWVEGPIAEAIARRYLRPILDERPGIDALVLGCTHFPVLREAIAAVVGSRVALVDSAATTAAVVAGLLPGDLRRGSGGPAPSLRFLATDAPQRFVRVGPVFLGEAIAPASVELVDL